MKILMTSFRMAEGLPPTMARASIARWQPKDKAQLPEVTALAPAIRGKAISIQDFRSYPEPLQAYRDALWYRYLTEQEKLAVELLPFATSLSSEDTLALCCWCPDSKKAIEQMREYGTFVCHAAVAGPFLAHQFGIEVYYDQPRVEYMVKLVRMP